MGEREVAATLRTKRTKRTKRTRRRRTKPSRPRETPAELSNVVDEFHELIRANGGRPHGRPIMALIAPAEARCFECAEVVAAGLDLVAERLSAPESFPIGYSYDTLNLTRCAERLRLPPADARMTASEPRETFGLLRFRSRDEEGADAAIWLLNLHLRRGSFDDVFLFASARDVDLLARLMAGLELEHRKHERSTEHRLVVISEEDETWMSTTPVAWDDLVLPGPLVEEVRGCVDDFFRAEPLYRAHGIPHRRGILLAGPPGNGKSTILKAIATTVDVPVVLHVGTSNDQHRKVARSFRRAASLRPSVLAFEDIDSLLDDGPSLSVFLNLMDGLEVHEGILVVATTNRPDRIDPAIARRPGRFDRVFRIPEPDHEVRLRYLRKLLGEPELASTIDAVAGATEGFSMAFLKELTLQARLSAIRRGEMRPDESDVRDALEVTSEHIRLAARGLEERGIGFGSR